MTPLELKKYLFDIRGACELIRQFVAGKSFREYTSDAMLRSAVERQFEVIGEALKQALQLDPSLSERITDTGRIIAFRNRLIHGYASVSGEVVWGVVEKNLPILLAEVTSLLEPED